MSEQIDVSSPTNLAPYSDNRYEVLAGEHLDLIDAESAPLPRGYEYADPSTIKPVEVGKLMRLVKIGEHIKDDHIPVRNAGILGRGVGVYDVGVRSTDGSLVGFGALLYKQRWGELGDFVVAPDHQHKGIGRAIILERLHWADRNGIDSIYIGDFEPTNTLQDYYLQHGFYVNQAGEVVRGTDPRPLF
jgi:GNAT superfamily N-acetyltransferase